MKRFFRRLFREAVAISRAHPRGAALVFFAGAVFGFALTGC